MKKRKLSTLFSLIFLLVCWNSSIQVLAQDTGEGEKGKPEVISLLGKRLYYGC